MEQYVSLFSSDLWHSFFYFLGTYQGAFYRSSIELVISILLSYMVISEYTKTQINERKRELKYLSIAFVSLLINSLLEVSIYATVLFGGFSIGTISFFWPVLDRFLDLITLVLLVNAFIFPAFKTRLLRFKVD